MNSRFDAFQTKGGITRPLEVGANRTYHGAHGFTRDCVVISIADNDKCKIAIDGKEYEVFKRWVR